jgi:UDP-N-acetylmuramoyl-L-alanyl-D-glutamate--2,6-diaminopimelate ligase
MRLEELVQGISLRDVRGEMDREISAVCSDSRKVVPNALFAALRGEHRDGQDFARDAVLRGASVLVVDREIGDVDVSSVTVIRVYDVRKALAQIAVHFYRNPGERLHLIGVTGTNGKTTLTYLIRSALAAAGEKVGLVGTIGYAVGEATAPAPFTTPEPIVLQALLRTMVDAGCRFAVMEVSSHALALDRVYGCGFDTAVFTNLTRDHLDFHSDMEAYYRTKAQLFRPPLLRNRAVIHGDDPYGRRLMAEVTLPTWSYGVDAPWDIRAEQLSLSRDGIRFDAVTPAGIVAVHSRLVGRYNVANILGAIGACLSFGLSLNDISRGLREVTSVPGRMEKIDEGQDFTVIVDYAHTEDALRRVLQAIEGAVDRRILVVFGCGGDRDRGKRPAMGRAAAQLSDLVILTSDNPRGEEAGGILSEIESGIRESMEKGEARARDYLKIEDRQTAIHEAIGRAQRGDLVVIAGKGHETVQIVGEASIPFDDREVAREAIRRRSKNGGGERR